MKNRKPTLRLQTTPFRKPADQANAVIFICLVVALLIPLYSHSQTRVLTGAIGVNRYSTGYNNSIPTYRSYSEDKFTTGVISLALLRAHGKKRRSLELSVLRRALVVNTFSGGLAGGGSNEIDMDLTYMNFSGFIGTRLTRTVPLFIDFGGYIGIPLVRNVVDHYRISISPPFDMNNGSGTNNDPNEYFTKIEAGAIFKTGLQFKVSEKIAVSITLRIHYAVGGRAKFNEIAFDRLAMIGVGRVLDKKQ